MKKILPILMLVLAFSLTNCGQQNKSKEKALNTGIWRAVLSMQDQKLPFNFKVTTSPEGHYIFEIINGDEKLKLTSYDWHGDTLVLPMHIFDTEIRAVCTKTTMKGVWVKNYTDDYVIPFEARHNEKFRFKETDDQSGVDFGGKWEVTFFDKDEESTAIGVFDQQDRKVTGTFLTPTGDYRYLEGIQKGEQLLLSSFDGEHAFLFKAQMQKDGSLDGEFWSGKHWNQKWSATRNESIELSDPFELTFLKEGYSGIDFAFPDTNGDTISLQDDKFKNQVIIIQILGTWCPNCMDETAFLSEWYKKNKDKDVKIVGLAFERKDDFNYAVKRINKVKDRYDIDYDILFAGKSDKDNASKKLPMLNHIMSFPTTIFIDKKGDVRKIHTGFSGPGTGKYYDKFVEEFNMLMDKMLSEEIPQETQEVQ